MNKAVFLDRDGVLIEDTGHPGDPDKIIFLHDIGKSVRKLNEKGYKAIVITNQSGVARGYFPEVNVRKINDRIKKKVAEDNGVIDGFYYCPHHPNDNCECRKPKTGMLLKAKKDFDIDFNQSIMIGDTLKDVEAGRNAGCKTILISSEKHPEYQTAGSLSDAVEMVE